MNCNQCGKEIPDNSVFCPFCGVPQKVTADYDYIQGEIGANVNKIKTGDGQRNAARRRASDHSNSDMYKTRNVYGSDTIYEDRPQARNASAQSRRAAYDDYDRYDDYDDYEDDYYEYEDWGMESGGGNGKTILTTIIIAIICLAGIAAIIYFGLRPQDKTAAVDVVRLLNSQNVEVSEGEEFDGKMELVLLSEQGYEIHYTTDGSDVDINDPVYKEPIVSEEEGSILVKAQSFDPSGKPSGEMLSKTVVVVKEKETKKKKSKKETTTEATVADAAVTNDEAEKIVEAALIEEGAMKEDYSTDNGGFINLIHAGQAAINDADYYIIQADYYDAEGSIWESTYYGVNTQDGSLSYLDKQDDTYLIVE